MLLLAGLAFFFLCLGAFTGVLISRRLLLFLFFLDLLHHQLYEAIGDRDDLLAGVVGGKHEVDRQSTAQEEKGREDSEVEPVGVLAKGGRDHLCFVHAVNEEHHMADVVDEALIGSEFDLVIAALLPCNLLGLSAATADQISGAGAAPWGLDEAHRIAGEVDQYVAIALLDNGEVVAGEVVGGDKEVLRQLARA